MKGWKAKGFDKRPEQSKEAEKKAPGPKRRKLAPGKFEHWNNRRVSVAVLMVAASLIMAQITAGVPLTVTMILSMVLGVFQHHGVTSKPKLGWTRNFLKRIGISYRKGTAAAQHRPADFDAVKERFLQRIVYLVVLFSIMKVFVFNIDEAGVRFLPLRGHTWSVAGATDTVLQGDNDKRQFTGTVMMDATGAIADRVQLIWQGTTSRCQPPSDVQQLHADVLSHVHSASHWSTPTTMEALVDGLWANHVLPKFQALGLLTIG